MRERLWLVKNGVPWNAVFGNDLPWGKGEIPESWAMGLSVVFSEFKGNKFSWDRMEFDNS